MKELILAVALTTNPMIVQAESCEQIAYSAGLITNYRMSEGEDKKIKDLENWWIFQSGSNMPPKYFALAQWVWGNDLVVPIDAYNKYLKICNEKHK